MSNGARILLKVEIGVPWPVSACAANVTLPRIGPVSRRPVARTAVSWTLTKGAQPETKNVGFRSA